MQGKSRQWLLADHPNGRPIKSTDFKFEEASIDNPREGEILLKVLWLGFDPAQKGWMENIANYMAPMQLGEVMRGSGIAQVVESRHAGFKVGELVTGMMGWREYLCSDGIGLNRLLPGVPPTANLSVMGTTGLTAYFGLKKIGRPVAGDTVVVSGAAGATGSTAGQIAKIGGCRVIGIAGGPEKCDWLTRELGFDGAIDYKSDKVRARLRELCPHGIDVVYDNVGGDILNDMLGHIAMNARVIICGGISRYELGRMPKGPENYFNLVFRRATMAGFLLTDFASEFPEGQRRLGEWIKAGKLKYREDVQTGIENAPSTLLRLFAGANMGKQLLKVGDPLPGTI